MPKIKTEPKKSLTYYRKKRGLSIDELAVLVGVSPRTIRYWEDDDDLLQGARVKNIIQLCKVLKIKVDRLF